MSEIGVTRPDVLDQLGQPHSVLDPEAALAFVAIGADDGKPVHLRICGDLRGLIFD